MDKTHLESQFDPSIAPAVVPLFPGISPEVYHRMMREFYKKGRPWKNTWPPSTGWADPERALILKNASKAGNVLAQTVEQYELAKWIAEKYPEDLTEGMRNTIKNYERTTILESGQTLEDYNKLKKIKTDRINAKMGPVLEKIKAGMNTEARAAIREIPKGQLSLMDKLKIIAASKGAENSDLLDDVISPKNKKYSIWNSLKGYGSAFMKTPLGKVARAAGKLAKFGGLPLLVAGELDWSNRENSFMPEYEYTPIGGSTVWEDING